MATSIYTPLDLETGEIRLLGLLPGTFEDQIRVALNTVVFSTGNPLPVYEALSHTWSAKEDPVDILVEKTHIAPVAATSTLAITQNLAIALCYLRREDETRVLWIDAICVNQQDPKERRHQVERMVDIYRSAAEISG